LHRFDRVAECDEQTGKVTNTHSKTDASTTANTREELHTVAREKSCAVLNFARFGSLVCIVARSREKSRSLSLVQFLARCRSLSLSLTGLVRIKLLIWCKEQVFRLLHFLFGFFCGINQAQYLGFYTCIANISYIRFYVFAKRLHHSR